MSKSYAAALVHTAAPSGCHFCPCTPVQAAANVKGLPPVPTHNFSAWAATALALFKGKAPTYIDFQSTT